MTHIDYAALLQIVFLDVLLGGDNAIVIAMACAALPQPLRVKGMVLGAGAAILLRVLALGGTSVILGVPCLKIVAGLALAWIGVQLLVGGDDDGTVEPQDKLWSAVRTVAVADLMMSLDNVLAVSGAAQSAGEHSVMYASVGVALSIPIVIGGASFLTSMIDKYPGVTWFGGGLLGWVGFEMILGDPILQQYIVGLSDYPYAKYGFLLCGALLVMAFASVVKTAAKAQTLTQPQPNQPV